PSQEIVRSSRKRRAQVGRGTAQPHGGSAGSLGRQPGNRFSQPRAPRRRWIFTPAAARLLARRVLRGDPRTEGSVRRSGPGRTEQRAPVSGGVGMAAAVVASLVLGGEGTLPAGRRKGSSRRRNLAVGLLSAIAAASAGAAFGVVGSPNPREDDRVASAAFTAAAAVQSAQRSEERAQAAEKAVAEMKSRLEQLRANGAVDEMEHYQAA